MDLGELAEALRSLEIRIDAVRLALHVDQFSQREALAEICRDLSRLSAQMGRKAGTDQLADGEDDLKDHHR